MKILLVLTDTDGEIYDDGGKKETEHRSRMGSSRRGANILGNNVKFTYKLYEEDGGGGGKRPF
jgi:hypothetical protein